MSMIPTETNNIEYDDNNANEYECECDSKCE